MSVTHTLFKNTDRKKVKQKSPSHFFFLHPISQGRIPLLTFVCVLTEMCYANTWVEYISYFLNIHYIYILFCSLLFSLYLVSWRSLQIIS